MSEAASAPPPNRWRKYAQRSFWPVIASFTALFWIVFILNQSHEFSRCVHDGKKSEEYKELNKGGSVFVQPFKIYWLRWRLYTACTGHFTDNNEGALVAVATLFLAIFTFTLWRATVRLGELAGTQAQDMQQLLIAARQNATAAGLQAEAMRQLHLAAEVQAGHADRAITSAEKIARLQLRAYITVEPGGIVQWEPNGEPSGSITARNLGKTPAYDVQIALKIEFSEVPPATDASDTAPIVIAGDMMIAPDAHQRAAIYPVGILGEMQFEDVFTRRKFIIMTGFVKYRDAFGKHQRTRFCHLYQGPDLGKEFARYHRLGNGAT